MRVFAIVLGVVVALAGAVWALQGIGLLPGSFMSGDPTWIWIGTATAAFGAGVVGFGLKTGPSRKGP